MILTAVAKCLEIDRCCGGTILISRGSYCHSCKSGWKVSHWTILTKSNFSKENWTILWDCITSNTIFDRNVSKWIVLPYCFIFVIWKYFIWSHSFFMSFFSFGCLWVNCTCELSSRFCPVGSPTRVIFLTQIDDLITLLILTVWLKRSLYSLWFCKRSNNL